MVIDGVKAAELAMGSCLELCSLVSLMPRPLNPVINKCCCCHVQATKLMWVEKPKLSDFGKLVYLSHSQWWC